MVLEIGVVNSKDDAIIESIIAFENRVQACRWNVSQINAILENNGLLILALNKKSLVGYLMAQIVVDKMEIIQVTVDPAHRRQGMAKELFNLLITEANKLAVHALLLEVKESNQAAIGLYKGLGFGIDGIRKNYYLLNNGLKENAVLMSFFVTC